MKLEPLSRVQRSTLRSIHNHLTIRQVAWMVSDSLPFSIKNRAHQCEILERKGWLRSECRGQHPLIYRYYQPSPAFLQTRECLKCEGSGTYRVRSLSRHFNRQCPECKGVGRIDNDTQL